MCVRCIGIVKVIVFVLIQASNYCISIILWGAICVKTTLSGTQVDVL